MTRGATREGRVHAALAAYALIKKRRETLAARAAFQLRLHVERLQRNALVAGVIACVAMADDERRTVERARGRWRGSTMSGYLRGDEVTCQHNFHSSIAQLDGVVDANVVDLEARAFEHHRDKIFTNVVNVTFDGADDHGANRLGAGLG